MTENIKPLAQENTLDETRKEIIDKISSSNIEIINSLNEFSYPIALFKRVINSETEDMSFDNDRFNGDYITIFSLTGKKGVLYNAILGLNYKTSGYPTDTTTDFLNTFPGFVINFGFDIKIEIDDKTPIYISNKFKKEASLSGSSNNNAYYKYSTMNYYNDKLINESYIGSSSGFKSLAGIVSMDLLRINSGEDSWGSGHYEHATIVGNTYSMREDYIEPWWNYFSEGSPLSPIYQNVYSNDVYFSNDYIKFNNNVKLSIKFNYDIDKKDQKDFMSVFKNEDSLKWRNEVVYSEDN